MSRHAGVLLSISSLPSPYGIGGLGKASYDFVDFLQASGQRYWQILPLSPTGYGDSPYQSFSSYAGNPYLLDMDGLREMGLLSHKECCEAEFLGDATRVDYGWLHATRLPLIRKAYERSHIQDTPEYQDFCRANPWIDAYAFFMAIKQEMGGAPLIHWDKELLCRVPSVLDAYRQKLSRTIGFYSFVQYVFMTQWQALKRYANGCGVCIIGDLPIYVSLDSVDVWESPHLFLLDDAYVPWAVAGCPPDGFSPDGQVWGNPLYDWQKHEAEGFGWWRARLAHALSLYDVLRIDHFRGFDAYYAIPYGQTTAHGGHWERGPGMKLFDAVMDICQGRIIAEDLGYMTPSVEKLLQDCGFPGMRVLQFGFDARDGTGNHHHPAHYPTHCVAYSGTHDNQTLYSWYHTIQKEERQMVFDDLGGGYPMDEPPVKRLLATLMKSQAELCIIPMQDWLEKDDTARMNTPSTTGHNWQWRMLQSELTDARSNEILQMTRAFGR